MIGVLTECFESLVQILVFLQQSVVIEDYVYVVVCVLEEQEGQRRVYGRLALASGHDPDLSRLLLVVEVS